MMRDGSRLALADSCGKLAFLISCVSPCRIVTPSYLRLRFGTVAILSVSASLSSMSPSGLCLRLDPHLFLIPNTPCVYLPAFPPLLQPCLLVLSARTTCLLTLQLLLVGSCYPDCHVIRVVSGWVRGRVVERLRAWVGEWLGGVWVGERPGG